MKKIQFYLIIFFTSFVFITKINSAEINIYKKIDLFGEVLEKINKIKKLLNKIEFFSYNDFFFWN